MMVLFAEIYTDGSCHTQQCLGAWAAVILVNDKKIVLSGTDSETTHNRMEILAVIKSLQYIEVHFPAIKHVKIVSDSQYVIGLVARQTKFISSGYKTKEGKDIRNIDFVKELLFILSKMQVEFVKIKAHQKPTNTVNYNIEVDKLSRKLVRAGVK